MNRILVTNRPGSEPPIGLAAARAGERVGRNPGETPTAVVVEFGGHHRPATVFATAPAKDLEDRLRNSEVLPESVVANARGGIVFALVRDGETRSDPVGEEQPPVELAHRDLLTLLAILPESVPAFVVVEPGSFRERLELAAVRWTEVLIQADCVPAGEGHDGPSDPLLDLATAECRELADRVEIVRGSAGRLRRRRALAGRTVAGSARSDSDGRSGERGGPGVRGGGRRRGWRPGPGRAGASPGESGQATPLVLGAVFVLVLAAIAVVMLGGAVTGKARGQRTADLAALSAVRSMRDDLPRLLAPAVLPNGTPNPYHMPKPIYLARARLAAVRNAAANDASPMAVSVRFPDAASWAPVRARVSIGVTVPDGAGAGTTRARPVWAVARLSAPLSMGTVPQMATGGGYSGPLAARQGKGLRPDVAVAFDAMAAAAARAGVALSINSAFRSDAEQARLFAANPDPRMVARPGTSLHRCGTELDLGPAAAYGWLSANAARFGFVQRYSWEAWHYGFTGGPAPCSAAGNHTGRSLAGAGTRSDPMQGVPASLPGFVPDRFRRPILAAAMRWNVSAALLAAQLYAESGFNPGSVSPAGAMGIAQFMPGTAASYGLRDPFDPDEAIMAQAHLMSDLLKQFGSPALALAAYNAGPGAVAPCNCIPPYAETQAYVAKILAMLGGAGAIAPMPMELELVA
ncbi:MAG: transglycosylase SLT domain-containing protein [Solirubrobacterales bacterium]|nr:transglycosylase SLT domain-containing protein [Solirubrobacterales bacterium]